MSLLDRAVAAATPHLPRSLIGQVARRYISGEDLESAVRATRELNERGIATTLDVLGEDVADLDEAARTVEFYRRVLQAIEADGLDSNVSVKPTHLGLRLDRGRCREHLRVLVEEGARRGIFVRIDMEDSSTTDDTLAIYRDLRSTRDNLGVVLQSRLRRSESDARDLAAVGARVRVCKGIYPEPAAIAWQEPEAINRSFLRIVEHLLAHGCHVAVATHDPGLVEGTYRILEKLGGCAGSYEFQMLYGVSERLRDSIVGSGHPMRVYVPFGEEWYPYSMRRLRENPQIAGHVFRALVGLAR